MRSKRLLWIRLPWMLLPWILAPLVSTSAHAAEWNASVGMTSDYIVRGRSRSLNEGAIQGSVSLQGENPWTAGVWASSVKLYEGAPRQAELDYFLAGELPISRDFRLNGQATYYQFVGGSTAFSYDYTELAVSLSFQDTLSASVTWSPDYGYYRANYSGGSMVTDTAVSYELSARHPLNRYVLAFAGVGHADLGERDREYNFWSGGAEVSWDRYGVSLTYVDSDSDAQRLFRSLASRNAWIATLSVRLR